MRLEVFCEDRTGLTRELLEILASKNIDLRGIEIDISGIIYLDFPEIQFEEFSQVMAKIRRISGVKDVRKIQFMPSERRYAEKTEQQAQAFNLSLTNKTKTVNCDQTSSPLVFKEWSFEQLIGISSQHHSLIAQAKKLALLDQPLLISGETGTGKEILAKACHHYSHRSKHPFLVLSCISMPDSVAETELFGSSAGLLNQQKSKKGIFEQANGGTVFLDEIGEMTPHLQGKLLRFLQDGKFRRVGEEAEIEVDVRIIASTSHHLFELTQNGRFRNDLFYRLNVLVLNIAPLRNRTDDIAPLLNHFIRKYALQLGIVEPSLDDDVMEQLIHYSWPGNMRQMDNMVLRALTQSENNRLNINDFELLQVNNMTSEEAHFSANDSLDEMMRQYEAKVLKHFYHSFPSSRKLAKRLGVSHTSIANKLREYGIGQKETVKNN